MTNKNKIDLFKVFMAPTASEEVGKVLNSGYIGQGPQVEKFEEQLKKVFNHDYVTTLNSGTSGLHLALHFVFVTTLLSLDLENVKPGSMEKERGWLIKRIRVIHH